MEDEIRSLIQFFAKMYRGDKLMISGGMLYTEGCVGDFGCCSEGLDIQGVCDTLADLIGEELPKFKSHEERVDNGKAND